MSWLTYIRTLRCQVLQFLLLGFVRAATKRKDSPIKSGLIAILILISEILGEVLLLIFGF
jgi:hypothetical protein